VRLSPLIEIIADALQNMHLQMRHLAEIHDCQKPAMGEKFRDKESGAV
jgi:hypothetical protein